VNSTVVGIGAAIVALLALIVSWWYNRRSLYLETFENMIEHWQSAEMMKYRKIVAEEVKRLKEMGEIFPINHPPDYYAEFSDAMRITSHFFDSLGVRVYHKYTDRKLVYGSLGGTITNHWEILEPYIVEERNWLKQHGERSYHQTYFEWLSKDAKKFNPERHLPPI